jgi:outer membrane biosynthesis protein TonB
MKRSLILTLVFLLSLGGSTFASGDEPEKSIKSTETIKKMVDKHMVYPIFQIQSMEGTVEVSFKINDDGEVNILNIKSSNPDLIDYVVKKLKKIKLEESDDGSGQTIKYRFVFKKQA